MNSMSTQAISSSSLSSSLSVCCSCLCSYSHTTSYITYRDCQMHVRAYMCILHSVKSFCLLHLHSVCILCVRRINFMCRFFFTALRYMPIIIFLSSKTMCVYTVFCVQSFVFFIVENKKRTQSGCRKRLNFNDDKK